MKKKFLILIIFLSGIVSSYCQDEKEVGVELSPNMIEKRIEVAQKTQFSKMPREGDKSAVEMTLRSGGFDEAWAILQFYTWNQMDVLATQWWESKDRLNRIIILTCVIKNLDDEDIHLFLNKMKEKANRFTKKEAIERVEEVDFLSNNFQVILDSIPAMK